jgi:hypothetical protein
MASKADAAREALNRVSHLHPAQHADILRTLDAAGLLDNSGNGGELAQVHAAKGKGLMQHGRLLPRRTPRAAAAASYENERMVNNLKARARRLGYEMPMDEVLSPVEIEAAFAGKNVDERLAWKMTAGMLGII